MNTTLKITLTLISLAICTAVPVVRGADTTAPAPTEPTVAKPNKAIERLQAQLLPLNLTDEQKAKVDAIVQDEEKATAELRKDKGVTKEDRKAKVQELSQSTQDKIRAILTPEQAVKFDKHSKGKGKVKAADKTDGSVPL
jgi:Spy/CpxP family protein refolding chaperone